LFAFLTEPPRDEKKKKRRGGRERTYIAFDVLIWARERDRQVDVAARKAELIP
jgi:hypothetical protein